MVLLSNDREIIDDHQHELPDVQRNDFVAERP